MQLWRWRDITGRRPVETQSPILSGHACRQPNRLAVAPSTEYPMGKVHPSIPRQHLHVLLPTVWCSPCIGNASAGCSVGCCDSACGHQSPEMLLLLVGMTSFTCQSWAWTPGVPLGTYKHGVSVWCLQTGVRVVPGLPNLPLFLAIWYFSWDDIWKPRKTHLFIIKKWLWRRGQKCET